MVVVSKLTFTEIRFQEQFTARQVDLMQRGLNFQLVDVW